MYTRSTNLTLDLTCRTTSYALLQNVPGGLEAFCAEIIEWCLHLLDLPQRGWWTDGGINLALIGASGCTREIFNLNEVYESFPISHAVFL